MREHVARQRVHTRGEIGRADPDGYRAGNELDPYRPPFLLGQRRPERVGLVALSLIGDGTSARSVQPLTPDAVAREVSAASTPSQPSPAGPSPTVPRSAAPQTRPGGAHTDRAVTSPGGTAVARCDAAGAYLLSWSRAQGYRADDVHRGPAAEVWLQFESLKGRST